MKRRLCAAILVLESIALGLATPVLIAVADVPRATALWIGLGLCVACLLLSGLLRFGWAYLLGWAVQVAALALGIETGAMIVLGAIFLALWATAYFLGHKIDEEKAAAWAAYRAEQGEAPAP